MFRQISVLAVSAALKVQKPNHPMVEINPYQLGGVSPPDPSSPPYPGSRPDNMWHHYDDSLYPWKPDTWTKLTFVEKTHWGYYTWPK